MYDVMSFRTWRVIAAAAAVLVGATPAMAQRPSATQIRSAVEGQVQPAFALYRELLTLPNDAHHPEDIRRLLAWWDSAFARRGFTVSRLPTAGADLLLAERRWPGARRTMLVYLQADGQPVDPSKWEQESAFKPVLKERGPDGRWRAIPWERLEGARDAEWRIFARSASDSKGPNAQFLAAIDVLDRLKLRPDYDVKVILDAEEELGSPNLAAAVQKYRDRLAADGLVIFDGPPHVSGKPTLTFGARGIATVTLTTHGPVVPQHSGHYGNFAPNPAMRLAQVLASMKDPHGRVTIAGWYDGVRIDSSVRRVLAAVPDDERAIMRALGIATRDSVGGSLQEALQYPSLNVRGLSAAWVGAQARTIVPATATAEIDIRLVKESDGARLMGLLRRHVESLGYHLLDGEPTEADRLAHPRLATLTGRVEYGAFRAEFDSELGRWLTRALVRLHGSEPIRIRTGGGSIPISPFVETLGIPAVLVPTVNPDNNQHSPNENLRVGDFLGGIGTVLAVLTEPFGGVRPAGGRSTP